MTNRQQLIVALLLLGLVSACGDNPVDDDHDHEEPHLEDIHRLALVMNDVEIAVIEDNQLAGGDPGRVIVTAGQETPSISLEAVDADGVEIHLDELDEEFSLGYDAQKLDATIAEWVWSDLEPWSFRLLGKQAGTTTLVLELRHGDHADFRTPEITVEVVASP